MRTRTRFSDRAELFGGNALAEVVAALADLGLGAVFHGAEIARRTGYSRGQTQRELAKLRRLQVIEEVERAGRTERLRVADDALAQALLTLSRLIDERLAARDAIDEA
jgi:hypothetical protein